MPLPRIIREPPDPRDLPPPPPPPKGGQPAGATDYRLQTSETGRMVPIVYGTARVAPNVIERYLWRLGTNNVGIWQPSNAYTQAAGQGIGTIVGSNGNLFAVTVEGTSGTGTPGQGPSGTGTDIVDGTVHWTYCAAGYQHIVALAVCEGQIVGLGKAWQDKLNFAAYTSLPHVGPWLQLFLGTPTGLSRPSWFPVDANGLVYSNTAVLLVIFQNGTDNSLPNTSLEVQGIFSSAVDASPADIATDLLTHVRRGAGWPSSRVDAVSTGSGAASWRTYCTAAGLNLSWAIEQQQSVKDLLEQLLAATNTDAVWTNRPDGLGGMLKFVPRGDQQIVGSVTYTPAFTPVYPLSEQDFLEPLQVNHVKPSATFNSWPVEYVDRAQDYSKIVVDDPDMADVDKRGLRRQQTVGLPMVIAPASAVMLSRIYAQRSISVLNSYTFKVGYRFLLLEPGDVVTLADSVMGLTATPVRITTKSEDQSGDGSFTFTAEDWPTAAGVATQYTPQTGDGFKPNVATPLQVQVIVPAQIPPGTIPDAGSTRGGSVDNLWPNPTSENAPPDGANLTTAEWAGRVNAGSPEANAGNWIRQLTALTNAAQLLGATGGSNLKPSYQSQLGFKIPCAPGERFYIEAMTRFQAGVAASVAGVDMYFLDASDVGIGTSSLSTTVVAPTLQDTGSLINNGGGEVGTLGAQATGWTLNSGNGLLVANDFAKVGTQSLKTINAGVTDSFSYQDVAVVVGQEYVISGWIKTTALPTADAGTGAYFNVDPAPASGVTGFTILEKVGVGADPSALQPDVGIAADGAIHDWTFVKCRFIPNGANGNIRIYCQLGYLGGQSGTAWFDDVRLIVYGKALAVGTAPAGAVAVRLFCYANSNLGAITTYFDGIYARRQVDAGVIGQLGGYLIDEIQSGALKALGRQTSGSGFGINVDRVWYRGNCDNGTLSGAPNINKLTINAWWDTTKTVARLQFTLQPSVAADNLDGMRYAKADIYLQSNNNGISATLTLIGTLYTTLPDRLYKVPGTDSDTGNLSITTNTLVDAAITSGKAAAVVTIYNSFGSSEAHCFYTPVGWAAGGALTDNGTTFPGWITGASGGGSGGGGGGRGCLDPETPVLIGPRAMVPLRTLRVGDRVWTRPEGGGEFGMHVVESVRHTTNLRQRTKLRDGREFISSVNHLVNVRGLWRRADWLQPGDELQGDPGGVVRDVEYLGEGPVVQLSIPTARTYFAGDGCWHHNTLKP